MKTKKEIELLKSTNISQISSLKEEITKLQEEKDEELKNAWNSGRDAGIFKTKEEQKAKAEKLKEEIKEKTITPEQEVCECGHGEHTDYFGCKVPGCPCMRYVPKKAEDKE